MRGVHHFVRECGCRIPDQSDVVTEFHRIACGGLDAGIRKKSDDYDVWYASLPQLRVQIGIGEAALSPMFLGHDITLLRGEVRMPVAAPLAACERVTAHDADLRRIGMVPIFIVARFPSAMRGNKN